MRKISTKSMALVLGMLVTLSGVNANTETKESPELNLEAAVVQELTEEQKQADKVTHAIWSSEGQEKIATTEDKIANVAWTMEAKQEEVKVATTEDTISKLAWGKEDKQNEELLAMAESEPVAYAADLDEEPKQEPNEADKVTKAIWSGEGQEKAATTEDKIANVAWTQGQKQNEELLAMAESEPVAYAADLDEEPKQEPNEADKVTKAIWSGEGQEKAATTEDKIANVAWTMEAKQEEAKVATTEDTISRLAWGKEDKQNEELLAMAESEPVAYAADLDEEPKQEPNEADKVTRAIWAS